jgi:hypothetical protein
MMSEQAVTAEDSVDAEVDERGAEHLDDVEPGAGCTEIWEHLSEQRSDAD